MCLETFGGVLRASPASTQTGSASPLASSFRIRQRTGWCSTLAKCFSLTADEVGAGAEVFMPPANTLSPRSVKPFNPTNDFHKLTDEHSTHTDGL
jgi:hypothetical protein